MLINNFNTGDLVSIRRSDLTGSVGIVTRPIDAQNIGHVLVYKDESIVGLDVSIEDVKPIGKSSKGFTQLGYNLIKLGSHVIEKKLMLYRT